MAIKEKKYFYPVRDPEDPTNVHLEEISKEVYKAIYPDIWRTQKQMQRLRRCICQEDDLWSCDGDCLVCQYYTAGNQVSFGAPVDDSGDIAIADVISDDAPLPEDILCKKDLLKALCSELERLNFGDRYLCELLKRHSERKTAKILNIPRSTFKYKFEKMRRRLRKKLHHYYY